ncbi:MAG TPA: hypothetical protein DER33_09655 [Syntrophomonas sp.]|nr:hypothetical protein [Syntrophomonas sp.]HCF71829.1 hypothetical protein [Syntrophomonas sp.]
MVEKIKHLPVGKCLFPNKKPALVNRRIYCIHLSILYIIIDSMKKWPGSGPFLVISNLAYSLRARKICGLYNNVGILKGENRGSKNVFYKCVSKM